jgi:hypothetical protein
MKKGLVGVWMSVAMTCLAGAQSSLYRNQTIDPGSAGEVKIGLIDGDEFPDLVGGNGPSVYLNQGDGTFGAPIAVPSVVSNKEIVDVTGDGIQDLVGVTASIFGDRFIVQQGDGFGNFTEIHNYATFNYPLGIDAGDMDGDGDIDVAVAVFQNSHVHLYLNAGDGSFPVRTDLSLLDNCQDVTLADVNEDDILDLIVSIRVGNAKLGILLGNGDGTFGAPTYKNAHNPHTVAVGDVTDDGNVDLVVGQAKIDGSNVQVFQGNGDGTFQAAIAEYGGGDYVVRVALADLEEDGYLDIVATPALADSVAVLPGRAGGLILLPRLYGGSDNPQYVEVADLNLDGDVDVVLSSINGDKFSIYYGRGDGTLEGHYRTGLNPWGIVTADFNQDGFTDLVTSNLGAYPANSTVSFLAGDGTGHFAAADDYAAGPGPHDMVVEDFDEDGLLDLVVCNEKNPNVNGADAYSFLKGNGDGSFDPPVQTNVSHHVRGHLHVEDFDKDQHLDLVMLMGNVPASPYVFFGDGTGSFQLPVRIGNPQTYGPRVLGVGDFNNDSIPDLITYRWTATQIRVRLGDGTGGFLVGVNSPISALTGHLVTHDFNNDTFLDVACCYTSGMRVLLGNGDGTLNAETDYPGAWQWPEHLAVGDVNRDGIADILGSGQPGGTIANDRLHTWLGNGDGTFQPDVVEALDNPTNWLVVGDFNRDEADDVAVTIAIPHVSGVAGVQHVSVLTSQQGSWRNLGNALAGSAGTPTFRSYGPLRSGTTVEHILDGVEPNNPLAFLILGVTPLNAPFGSGIMVPFPDAIVRFPTDSNGEINISATWPAVIPGGINLWYQFWIADAQVPGGFSASNAMIASTQ